MDTRPEERIRAAVGVIADALVELANTHDIPLLEPEHVFSLKQVAEILGVSVSGVWRLRARGALRGIRVGRRWVFAESEVRRFQAAGGER